MVNTLSLQKWSNISATPTVFTLRGGLYALTVHAANWSSFATGTLAFATNPTDADTVTLGSITYRFKGTMAQANDVKLESTAAATLAHLVKAINATGIAGTDYYTGTTINTKASAAISTTNLVATALTAGDNTVTSTQSITGGTDTWGAATLGGATAGSITLQRQGKDGSTYITALTAFTADKFATAQLPSGNYQLTIANSSAIYADLVAIDEPV